MPDEEGPGTDDTPRGKVYHGTDATSAENIRRLGLNENAWRAAANGNVDEKGFSVTTDRATAEAWARTRAWERGGPAEGAVLEAEANDLPLRPGAPDEWIDPDEWFIQPEDFPQVGPGVFQ
jgi:hypothetical protein